MKKKTKPGAIQQLLSYAGNNKKQLYLSTFLATLGELFGMAPFITVSLLVAELFNKTATIQNVCILFAVALGGQILKLWLTYQSSFMSHKATYKILKNIRGWKKYISVAKSQIKCFGFQWASCWIRRPEISKI